MRIVSIGVVCGCLIVAGCGKNAARQAGDHGSASTNASSVETAAAATPATTTLPPAVTDKDQALSIMHSRHEGMEALGKSMKSLHRALDASPADMNSIKVSTAQMVIAAKKIPTMFPAGTGPDVGKTRAKADIWKQPDLFLHKSSDFLAAAQAIDAAAQAGDANKVMALHENVDKACKACHDPFRAPEH